MKRVMLLGRTPFDLDDWRTKVGMDEVELCAGTSVEDVRRRLDESPLDLVISGAGLPLEARLEIVELVFEKSSSTSVHLKDFDSGKDGMVAFVKGVLSGLVQQG